MAFPRRTQDDAMAYGDSRQFEQNTGWSSIPMISSINRVWAGDRPTQENTSGSQSGNTGPRNGSSNQQSSHSTPSHRNHLQRDPPPEKTADRLRRERNAAEEERDKLIDKVETLEKELEAKNDVIVGIKASTQRVLASTQEKELFLGPQALDRDLQADFFTLFKAIRTWSRFLGGTNIVVELSSIDPEVIKEFSFIVPGLDELMLQGIMSNPSKRKYLAQAWIGLKMTKELFSTLPEGQDLGNTIKDLWIENDEARESFHTLERSLLGAVQPDGNYISHREFHDWRAYTASLMSKATTSAGQSIEMHVYTLASNIMEVLRPWSKGSTVHEEMGHELMGIFKSAVQLSKLLRLQRASWSVRYPSYSLVVKSPISADSNTARESMQHIAMFDPSTMRSVAPHDPEERTDNKFVEIITSPALFKRGNADGLRFETIAAMSPSAVLWAELEGQKPQSGTDHRPVAPLVPARKFTGEDRKKETKDATGSDPSNPEKILFEEPSEVPSDFLHPNSGDQQHWPQVPNHEPSNALHESIHDFVNVEHTSLQEPHSNADQPRDRQRSRSPKKPQPHGTNSVPPVPLKAPIVIDAQHPNEEKLKPSSNKPDPRGNAPRLDRNTRQGK